MKKFSLITLILFVVLTITSCNKHKSGLSTNSNENSETENVLIKTTTPEIIEENQNPEITDNEKIIDENFQDVIDKNAIPEEFDIATEHETKTGNWFMSETSPDGKYIIWKSSEYYYTYERYCIPIECERKDLNLIMLKEKSNLYNPNDMGANNKDVCDPGCEFVPIARSRNPILFNEQTSYWFKVSENKWMPGSYVYIQPGAFEKLPVEDIEVGMAYEKINDGAWFVVKTDDGSSLRLRDSSNIQLGKVISSIPQGTWIYADAQTTKTETIDGIEARWYKIIYPEKGYVFGGYLEKQDDVCGLEFAQFEVMQYPHDDTSNYTFKVYSAPTTKSQYLGEYEIKPDGYGYTTMIETKELETVDGIQGVWINIKEPVEGFIFGYNFIYK